jgi:pyruvate kinase
MNSINLNDKKTKIIATIGPSSDNREHLKEMFYAGGDIIRINASHRSEPEIIKQNVDLIRDVSKEIDQWVSILMDLQGPKIRVGKFKNGKVTLHDNAIFSLTTEKILGDETRASVSYKGFTDDIQIGNPIYIDDGKIQLVVRDKKGNQVICEVIQGGILSNQKGLNLPDTKMSISPITEKDYEDALLAIETQMDYIALSFVSHEDDIKKLRKFLDVNNGHDIKIIAKIERPVAVERIDAIIKESDAVMVARGDLGVEIGVENVPRVQKMIISKANQLIKPVIVATQMLESMIHASTATRAEVSDVANAIYDSCDAVMLSGETAIGIDPTNSVSSMAVICKATDTHVAEIKKNQKVRNDQFDYHTIPISICKAANQVAEETDAAFIMAFTSSGNTPLIASKLNSTIPIISPIDDPKIGRRVALYRGVQPMMMPIKFDSIARWTDMINLAVKEAKTKKLIKKGDVIVVTAGIPIGQSDGINSIRLIKVS